MERQNKFNMKKQKDFFGVWTDSEEKKKRIWGRSINQQQIGETFKSSKKN